MNWEQLVKRVFRLRRFGVEPGLERVKRVLADQGRPEQSYDVINVAGTNGKGTVASMIGAILQAHNLRVGLYTSPHLIDIRERFRVDGRPVSIADVEPVARQLFEEYRLDDIDGEPELTFFEFTTVTAAMLFAEHQVDIAVFEVGLGGRLDAVNAIEPKVSVVTPVGKDHTEYLGDKIGDIAREKAGIFRADTPAVIGPQEYREATRALRQAADDTGATVVEVDDGSPGTREDSIAYRHQRTARRAVDQALGDRAEPQACREGVRRWNWPGRFEEIEVAEHRRLYVDAAHNAGGLRALKTILEESDIKAKAIVWGAMSDKEPGDLQGFLSAIGAPVWGAQIDGDRSRSSTELEAMVPDSLWQESGTTTDVLEKVRRQTDGDIVVFGSVYLVGEVYQWLGRTADSIETYSIETDRCD